MAKKERTPFRKKRGDTLMGTIEKKYGKDFGVRSDKKLKNFLNEKGYNSLSKLIKGEPQSGKKENKRSSGSRAA